MFEENNLYNVYVKTDEKGRITAINSDAFLDNTEGWTLIDSGSGDKYHHAQGNFLGSLFDDRGLYLYALVNGKPAKRSAEEVEADYKPAEQKPTINERMEVLEKGFAAFKKLVNAFMGVKE